MIREVVEREDVLLRAPVDVAWRGTDREAGSAYVHPTALVEAERIGAGTRVWAFTHISSGVAIGDNCNIGSHCYVETGVSIGDSVTVKNGNFIWAGVTIRDGAFVGPQVVFTNDLHPRSPRLVQASPRYSSDEWLVPTLVEEGVSIGGGAVILAGVTLSRFCMIAAGAVVTKSVSAHALVMGVPASMAGWVCSCGTRLKFEGEKTSASCEQCFREFESIGGELRQKGAGLQRL
jgi:UDP-2-acetamido-3-amino-2,3-dideoxy-glucuronate N-acetyltransferase